MALVSGNRLESILDTYAERKVRSLSQGEVLSQLQAQGINTLEDLVAQRLADFKKGGDVKKETFVYTQFVYHNERVVEEALLDVLETRLRDY